ncbi:MAG: M1 family metallopeptidase [Tissierellia bacterium]|nr:M1 family metallopeptidase [Tissierellia bacterium]
MEVVNLLKKKLKPFILILIVILVIAGSRKGVSQHPTLIVDDYNGVDLDNINHYEIEVEFYPDEKYYKANQKVTYVNDTGQVLGEIYFHLYPNAFRSMKTCPILFDDTPLQEEDYDPGYMEIEEVRVGKRKADYQIGGRGDTILKLKLPSPLNVEEKIDIQFTYRVKLPTLVDRFGYGEDVFNFGNWYPIACVYDDSGWNLDPYFPIGDPFYSQISNYDVKITVPKDMVIAASGNIISQRIRGDKKIYTIEGRLIRDFAWVASSNFSTVESKVGDTLIRLYTMEDNPEITHFVIEVGKKCMEIFNRIFGSYPYGVYSIVMTEFPTGMEYPGIVFINKDYYSSDYLDPLEKVIVHETAHQWWYGVVGNDQIDEAWLDEALATYSEVIYMINRYGEKEGEAYYNYTCKLPYEYVEEDLVGDGVVNKSLYEFNDWQDYGLLVYIKGAIFINQIKDDFGLEILYDILNKYYNTYKFYTATTEDFIKICEEVTNTSFKEKVDRWLYNR